MLILLILIGLFINPSCPNQIRGDNDNLINQINTLDYFKDEINLTTYNYNNNDLNPDFSIKPKIDSVVLSINMNVSDKNAKTSTKISIESNNLNKKRIKITTYNIIDYSINRNSKINFIVKETNKDLRDSIGNKYRYSNLVIPIINYFKELSLSIENKKNGFPFTFNLNKLRLIIYYQLRYPGDTVSQKLSKTYSLELSNTSNVKSISSIFERSIFHKNVMNGSNEDLEDEKILLQLMNGTHAIIKLNQNKIDELRKKVKSDRLGIISAKLKIFVGDESQNLVTPPLSIFSY